MPESHDAHLLETLEKQQDEVLEQLDLLNQQVEQLIQQNVERRAAKDA